MSRTDDEVLDLLVVGAGPTGIAIGADAVRAGLDVLLMDRGPLTASLQAYPVYMTFFTTRDLLEIAGIPMSIPEDKPDRRQAIAYYRSVVQAYDIATALYEEVVGLERVGEAGELFRVHTVQRRPDLAVLGGGESSSRQPQGALGGTPRSRLTRAVALATGYFGHPRRLGVPGEELPWVSYRYREPYLHYGQHVVVVGGGNSAAEAALDLWRNGAKVTVVHRRDRIKDTVKYWVKPDIENRIAQGSIAARFGTVVCGFSEEGIEVRPAGEAGGPPEVIDADAAYVLIGYQPDVGMLTACGVEVDPESLKPVHDPVTLKSNVRGVYVAGTALAGRRTDRIFIENTRDHGEKIVAHLRQELENERRVPVPT